MAQPTNEDQILLLVSYGRDGAEWEEYARGDFEEEVESLVKELPSDIQHYSLVRVYDCGVPVSEEDSEEYEY